LFGAFSFFFFFFLSFSFLFLTVFSRHELVDLDSDNDFVKANEAIQRLLTLGEGKYTRDQIFEIILRCSGDFRVVKDYITGGLDAVGPKWWTEEEDRVLAQYDQLVQRKGKAAVKNRRQFLAEASS